MNMSGLHLTIPLASLALCTFLSGVLAGRPWLVASRERTLRVIVPACMLAATAIAHASVGEVCSVATHAGATGAERGFDGTSTPAAIFGALFIQGVVQVFTAQSEQAKQSMAMVTVWLVTCLFYLRQWLAPPCALAVRWEHGGGLVPTQYALWSTSMSGQVATPHGLSRAISGSLSGSLG